VLAMHSRPNERRIREHPGRAGPPPAWPLTKRPRASRKSIDRSDIDRVPVPSLPTVASDKICRLTRARAAIASARSIFTMVSTISRCDPLARRYFSTFNHLRSNTHLFTSRPGLVTHCFRLERLPGGTRTHWKAPPLHGARQKRTTSPSVLASPRPTTSSNFSGDCAHLGLPYEPTDYTLPK
jgi:hypothetical protein